MICFLPPPGAFYILWTTFSFDFPVCLEDGKPHSLLHLLESDLEYGNEYYGSRMPIVLTPVTERCFLTLIKVHVHRLCASFMWKLWLKKPTCKYCVFLQATTEFQCCAIVGESGTGKTETAKVGLKINLSLGQ